MRLNQIQKRTLITESWNDSRLTLLETQHIIPFVSSIEKYIVEAQLTPDQISQLFTNVEQGATAAGGNRTMIGKGTDAAKFINTKMKELGQAVKKSGPVQNADAKFAELKAKIGAKDSKVVSAIQGVSDWAKENPGKASIAVAVLTVAASMAAGPMAGAIAGFISRASKDLLQGKDLSTAAGNAVKTAAIGAVAGAIADAVGGNIEVTKPDVEGGASEVSASVSTDDVTDAAGEDSESVAQALSDMTEDEYKLEYAKQISERYSGMSDVMIQKMADNITIQGDFPNNFNANFDGTVVRGNIYLTPDEAREISAAGFKGTDIMGSDATEWIKANVEGADEQIQAQIDANAQADAELKAKYDAMSAEEQRAFDQERAAKYGDFMDVEPPGTPKYDTGAGTDTGTDTDTDPETGANEPKKDSLAPGEGFTGESGANYSKEDLQDLVKQAAEKGEIPDIDSLVRSKDIDLGSYYRDDVDAIETELSELGIDPMKVPDEDALKAIGVDPAEVVSDSINFKSIQIETIIEWCDATPAVMLTEGPMDAIKKGAAAVGGAVKKGASAVGAKAAKVGKNITTKVTADKLNKAWVKAGKPTDSDAIANILRQQGVSDKVLAPVYKQMGAKLPAAPAADSGTPGQTGGTTAKPAQGGAAPAADSGTPGQTGGTTAAPAKGQSNTQATPAQGSQAAAPAKGQAATAPMDFKGIQQAVAKLSQQDAKALVAHIDSLNKTSAPTSKQPAATPNAAAQPAQAAAAPNAKAAAPQGQAPADAAKAAAPQGQAPADAAKAAPATNKNAAAGDTYEKAKGDIRKVQGGQKPMPPKTAATIASDLAKLAKGDKESGVAAAQKIMNFAKAGVDVSKQQQAWIANSKAGERFLTQSEYFELTKMMREHNLSWSDLGMRVHLLEGTNKMFGISYI